MAVFVRVFRLAIVFFNVYDSYKILKLPPSSVSNKGRPSLRAMSQRKRGMKGCLAVWIVWVSGNRIGRCILYKFSALVLLHNLWAIRRSNYQSLHSVLWRVQIPCFVVLDHDPCSSELRNSSIRSILMPWWRGQNPYTFIWFVLSSNHTRQRSIKYLISRSLSETSFLAWLFLRSSTYWDGGIQSLAQCQSARMSNQTHRRAPYPRLPGSKPNLRPAMPVVQSSWKQRKV